MNNIEGRINIDIQLQNRNIEAVDIQSSRPVRASKIMLGKTPNEVLTILPLMFSVCGVAQAHAAITALKRQLQIPQTTTAENARSILVLSETLREHLIRIFMDWPKLFDIARNPQQPLPAISVMINNLKAAFFQNGHAFALDSEYHGDLQSVTRQINYFDQLIVTHIFEQPLQKWLSIEDFAGLEKWSQQCSSVAARSIQYINGKKWSDQGLCQCDHLPELNTTELMQQFNAAEADEFIAKPTWKGKLYETTTLSRQRRHPLIQNLSRHYGNGLITRWSARLVELASLPAHLRSLVGEIEKPSDAHVHNNDGIAQIEAARGRLIHRVSLNQGKVGEYQILAPTEWNFHPKGLIQRSLSNIKSTDAAQVKSIARLLINAIDPCVGYDLRVQA